MKKLVSFYFCNFGHIIPCAWGHKWLRSWVKAAPKEKTAWIARGVDGVEKYGITGGDSALLAQFGSIQPNL